jgi:propionate CoA-transferase
VGSLRHDVDYVVTGFWIQRLIKPAVVITEREVFQLIREDLTFIEVAPEVAVRRDTLDCMAFEPTISPFLKTMPPEIFADLAHPTDMNGSKKKPKL